MDLIHRRAIRRQQLALLQMMHSGRELRGVRIVRHHHHRLMELLVQPRKNRENLLCRSRVKVASWFVGQNQRRVGHDRARYRYSLLLATRKLSREMA